MITSDSTREELLERIEKLENALRTEQKIIREAFIECDRDNDVRAFKLLKALSGYSPKYRTDIDEVLATFQP